MYSGLRRKELFSLTEVRRLLAFHQQVEGGWAKIFRIPNKPTVGCAVLVSPISVFKREEVTELPIRRDE
jgi:hypothetical protein